MSLFERRSVAFVKAWERLQNTHTHTCACLYTHTYKLVRVFNKIFTLFCFVVYLGILVFPQHTCYKEIYIHTYIYKISVCTV